RNDEIRALESKISGLVERIDQAEIARKEAEATATGEIERMRRQSQAELTARQAESEQKVEAFQQREAATLSAEQDLRLDIGRLRAAGAEQRSRLEHRHGDLPRGKGEKADRRERIAERGRAGKGGGRRSRSRCEFTPDDGDMGVDCLGESFRKKAGLFE